MNRPRSLLGLVVVLLLAAPVAGGCGSSGSGGDAGRSADAAAPDAARPDAAPPDAAAAVSCGDKTCGPDQYCHILCTCCGVPTDAMPSADYECRPIPAGCSAGDLCSCAQATQGGGTCDQSSRSIDIPCA